jgi:electron transfer flavoprotein alpha subunit
MSTFVIVEHNNQEMHPVTRHVVAAAKQFNQKIVLLVVGFNCQAVADMASKLEGVETVWLVDNQCFEHQLAENVSQLIVELASTFNVIMASSSTYGKNLLPRIAAQLDVAQISDVSTIINPTTFEHPVYAGNAIETVRCLDEKIVLSIRATVFDIAAFSTVSCPVSRLEKNIPLENIEFVETKLSESERPELTQAKIVVSGGRGLQNQENFKLIEQLADTLGAAVGASRAAVDAGFVPNDYQVGQTGKVVAPDLYIAIGISGAIQHLAGMKDSKVIVAVNKDEDAPIMQIATYYLVGDLFEIVPRMIEQLKH